MFIHMFIQMCIQMFMIYELCKYNFSGIQKIVQRRFMTLIQSYNTFMMEYLKGCEGTIFLQLADVFTTPINSTTVKKLVGNVRAYVLWQK